MHTGPHVTNSAPASIVVVDDYEKLRSQCSKLPAYIHAPPSSPCTEWRVHVAGRNCGTQHLLLCISGGVQSDFLPNPLQSMHCTHATRLPPGDLQKQWKILSKTFKNLVKMNNSTVLPCASHSSVPSGSWLPHWIPQGAPSKTVENPCVSEVWPLEFHWRS